MHTLSPSMRDFAASLSDRIKMRVPTRSIPLPQLLYWRSASLADDNRRQHVERSEVPI